MQWLDLRNWAVISSLQAMRGDLLERMEVEAVYLVEAGSYRGCLATGRRWQVCFGLGGG